MQTRESEVVSSVHQILDQVRRVIVGKDEALLWALAAILARGHILLEDIPGVGKTTMALSFARALDLEYGRIQFTPDVLPSDITGYSVPDPQGGLTYRPGGILCNLFLADELNRATSRTQSALLEAMEEGQVTVDGISHPLPQPFVVIATQNPVGAAGTQLLPDSQVDRFALRLTLGYPAPRDEVAMIKNRQGGNPLSEVRPCLTRSGLRGLQNGGQHLFYGLALTFRPGGQLHPVAHGGQKDLFDVPGDHIVPTPELGHGLGHGGGGQGGPGAGPPGEALVLSGGIAQGNQVCNDAVA